MDELDSSGEICSIQLLRKINGEYHAGKQKTWQTDAALGCFSARSEGRTQITYGGNSPLS